MKPILILFLLLISLRLFAEAEPDPYQAPQEFFSFINKFTKEVNEKNYKGVYKLLEKSYRKEQKKFLKGNKTQLIDELFGGHNELGTWVNTSLNEIKNIQLMEYELGDNGNSYRVYFEVELEDNILTVELTLSTHEDFKKWGIVGAMG